MHNRVIIGLSGIQKLTRDFDTVSERDLWIDGFMAGVEIATRNLKPVRYERINGDITVTLFH